MSGKKSVSICSPLPLIRILVSLHCSNNEKQEETMKEVKAIIERSSEGRYSIYMDDDTLSYLITAEGATLDEAKKDFIESYESVKEYSKSHNEAFEEVEFDFCYDMASFLQHYAYAFTLAGLSRITGVNQGQLSHYINGTSRPSARTIEKIENGISSIAQTLSGVHFVRP